MHRRILVSALLLAAAATKSTAQQPIPLDTLRASAGSRLVAGAAEASRSVEVIDRARLAAMPVRSINEALARALGVDLQARSHAQADLSIRGSGFEQVLVMVDGIPVNDHQTGHFHLNLAVPLDAVERIEVVRGPASALYGSAAVGGVVNIVTESPATAARSVVGRAQGGSFGAAAAGADARLTASGVAFQVAAGYDRSDGHRPGTDHALLQAHSALRAPLGGGAIRAQAGWAARDFGADGFYAPFDSYEETRSATASVAWQSRPAPFTVEPRLSFRQHDDDFTLVRDNPALYRNVHRTLQSAGELVLRWTPAAAAIRVAAGAEGVRSSLESESLGERQEDRGALFAEIAAGRVATLLATAGLRLDRHAAFGTHASPSVAAGWQATTALRLRASAAGGFRAPSWTDRYYSDLANIGSPDLAAERFWTAEAGFTAATAERRLRLDAASYIRQATDLIDWARPANSPPGEPWRTMNVERARFLGAETSLTTVLDAATVTFRAAVLDVDASTATGLESKYALRPLTRSISAETAAPLPAGFAVTARAAQLHRKGEKSWHLVDARLTRHFRRLDLTLDGTNLTDSQHADVARRPAPGRAWLLGVRIR
jgi:vitamin B12 transporter